jgi:hypothetical protein
MSDDTPARDPQLLERLYRVPLERPLGHDLLTVMANLLAHVLQVSDRQPAEDLHE